MDLWQFGRLLVLGSRSSASSLFCVIFLTFSTNYVSAREECTSYFNISRSLIPGQLCDDYCCGTPYNKYCCSNCSLSISQSNTCNEEEWDPTGTIVQCAFIGIYLIGGVVVTFLALMGKCDDPETIRMRNEKRPMKVFTLQTYVPVTDEAVTDAQGPPLQKSYAGAYPKQAVIPVSLPPDPQSMQLTEQNVMPNETSLPFSRPHSEAGSDPEPDDVTAMDAGLINTSKSDLGGIADAAILQIGDSPSHDGGPLISEPSLHSVDVHPEPKPRLDYGSTEQIIPLGRRDLATGGYEQNNHAFVDTPQHVPKHPGRLPPPDQNRTGTPSSVVLSVRPSPEPIDLDTSEHNHMTS